MFTFCLFMFWLHTVVVKLSKQQKKLQYTNRVNLSVFTVHLVDHYRHIFTVIYVFHKINSSRHNNIMGLKLGITMLIHNKDDIQFVTEFLCFLGHPVWLLKISMFYFLKLIILNCWFLHKSYLWISYNYWNC